MLRAADPTEAGLDWAMVPSWPSRMPNYSHGTAGIATALAIAGAPLDRPDFVEAAIQGAQQLLAVGSLNDGGFIVPYTIPHYRRIAQQARQEESHRGRRALHPGHRRAPTIRFRNPSPRPGSGYYDSWIKPERKKRNHIRELEALGYKVTVEPAARKTPTPSTAGTRTIGGRSKPCGHPFDFRIWHVAPFHKPIVCGTAARLPRGMYANYRGRSAPPTTASPVVSRS